MDLLCGDSDSEVDFTINEDYAKRYEKWRRGEEIQKLKDKYGDPEDSDSSTSEEEDEDGKELTKDIEEQFFKTLSCLKEKNPRIYDQNVRFFKKREEEEEAKEKGEKKEGKSEKKSQPTLTVAGYQRKVLLETDGKIEDEDENAEKQPFEMMSSQDQENDIKQSFKNVLKDSDDEDEEQWGNMFTKRVKTAVELEKEEEDFRQWLAGEKEKVKNEEVKKELKGLHDYWTDPKLDEGEKFLRDYILNRRYLENEDKNRIPSYDEIIHDSDSNLSADEDTINKQDEFEMKYNFRFEEPDREFIKRYPRTLEQSMRKKDDRRKIHREEVKQRKQAERSKKDEELKRLKALKKKEIMEKIKKLQHITGNEDIAFQNEDLEGDFDPAEHDKRMSQIFNEDYYDMGEDEEKPEFPDYDQELDIENWDEWEGPQQDEEEELHCEDPGFNMDCDYDPTKKKELQNELMENTKRRKRRRKSKFAESLEKQKPVFDPKDKTFEQYVDEYYALDYEDLIGDIPCRFKYRKVVPNDFGLSIEEILSASDQELNRWVSLKKITRRLPEHVEKYDVQAYRRKAANFRKKAKCFPSIYGPKDENEPEQNSLNFNSQKHSETQNKDRKKKNKSEFVVEDVNESINTCESEPKKKNQVDNEIDDINTLDEPAKGGKNKKKKKTFEDGDQGISSLDVNNVEESSSSVKKKKKKRKESLVDDDSKSKQTVEEPIKKKKKEENSAFSFENYAEEISSFAAHNAKRADGVGKKKKKEKQLNGVESLGVSNEEISGAGKKNKKKKKKKADAGDLSEGLHVGLENGEKNVEKKGKKKKNKSEFQNYVSVPALSEGGGKKKGKKRKSEAMEDENRGAKGNENQGKNHKKRKFNNQQRENEKVCSMSDERLKSYGLNPKKYKNKLKYKNKNKNC